MENVVLAALVVLGAAWLYDKAFRDGKRLGSRKGYGVGFDRGRRARGNASGCAVGVLIVLALLALALRGLAR